MERAQLVRGSGAVAAVVGVSAAAGLLAWLGLHALVAPRDPFQPAAAAPGRYAVPAPHAVLGAPRPAARDVLLSYEDCPAKCVVDLLAAAHPKAAIGAWCKRGGLDRFVCVSAVDDPRADLYECRAWVVRTDRRAGIEVLRTGPADCPPRPATPASGSEAR